MNFARILFVAIAILCIANVESGSIARLIIRSALRKPIVRIITPRSAVFSYYSGKINRFLEKQNLIEKVEVNTNKAIRKRGSVYHCQVFMETNPRSMCYARIDFVSGNAFYCSKAV